MSILCYVSEHIRSDVGNHGIATSKLDEFAAEVEKRQSLSGFDHFPPPCLTKKRLFGYNYRMVAVEKVIGDHLVVCFLRLLIRGGHEYADFNRDPPTWANRFVDGECDEYKLRSWVVTRTATSPPKPAPPLSDIEQTFLWSNAYPENYDDVMICEAQQWVASFEERRLEDRLILIPELILSAIEHPDGQVHTIHSSGDDRLCIQAVTIPESRQCLLLRAAYGESASTLNQTAEIWRQKLTEADSDTVLRYSRRSYPSIVCCDNDIWIAIQKDPQANLALSPEEADILRTSTIQDSNIAALPLFINGRAGSGKSTLLHYLFAQSFLRWGRAFQRTTGCDSCPLYFASSRELLNVANDVVDSLLSANHQQLIAAQPGDTALLGHLSDCFQEFIRYMHGRLDVSERDRFPWSRFVGYATFRRKWLDRFGHEKQALKGYGPQVSWHVIRGLIKGMSVDGLLERSDYDDLPEDERSVSRHVFEAVHDKVWGAWYEPMCRSGEAWDSQDLVRHLLDNERLPASHCAVFCDEAQDFTRLELEAIYQCSLFSNRQIDFQSLKRVPFVFAGDPFQTLNPTGFRWESVRAAFTERILRSLYRFNSRADVPQLNYRELTFNYRSSVRIVHFCNSIQAARASLFDHRSLGPQSTWQINEHSSPPVFFEKGDSQMEQALREQSDLVLIVPCEEGEEIDFVSDDDYLKRFVLVDDDGIPRNVLSAARSKGLEFLRVALYGWSGRDEAARLGRLMQNPATTPPTIDEKLTLEYFLNNLYVAASRARLRLFIIDDKEALNGLWWFSADESNLASVISRLPKKEIWEGHTGFLVRGIPENFSEDRDDPKAIAERFEREGISKEDGYLLRQAALQFKLAGIEARALECRAVADMFDGRFREAGQQFEQAALVDNALDAYWRGKHYSDIARVAGKHSQLAKHPQARVSTYLSGGGQTLRGCITLFDNLLENARLNGDLRKDFASSLWSTAAQTCLEKSVANVKDIDSGEASTTTDRIHDLSNYGLKFDPSYVARLQFAAKRYGDVLSTLGRDDGSDLYKDATALHLIATSFNGPSGLTASEARTIGDYYYRKEQFVAAAVQYTQAVDIERMLDCLRMRAEVGDNDGALEILRSVFEVLVSEGQWSMLVSLLTNGHPRPGKDKEWRIAASTTVLNSIKHNNLTLTQVVPLLSRSDRLATADVKAQNEVSELLASRLIRREAIAKWWEHLPRKIAGAAIERAGKDIDALEFYEKWRDAASSNDERTYAEKRWVICKLRQAKREESESKTKKASGYRHAAEQVVRRYGWDSDEIADGFPRIDTLEPVAHTSVNTLAATVGRPVAIAEQREKEEGTLGSIKYRFIPAKAWVNLESDDGLCARVVIGENQVTSEDVIFEKMADGSYQCELWNLRVTWPTRTSVALSFGTDHRAFSVGETILESC